jgi:hypothetical protein
MGTVRVVTTGLVPPIIGFVMLAQVLATLWWSRP